MESPNQLFQQLEQVKALLSIRHGATKLQNIPGFISSVLYTTLTASMSIDISLTVCEVLQRIATTLSAESVILQFAKFQEQVHKKVILPSQRLPENQRLAFYASKNTHEWIEMIFSPSPYYFTLTPKSFRKGDKQYNYGVFQNAIDTVIIDPEQVADSSLETLGITLDPNCQNLKNIFKTMHPLFYQDVDQQKYTIRINEYDGKYIVFVAHKIVFDAQQPATKGEQEKEDVQGHMSVYPDIFSMIRREEHILDTNQDKQGEYQAIKKNLMLSIKEIDRNKKQYSVRVQQNVQEIIQEIDAATSAKIVADKLYHLYKITGRHSENDKKLLEASMENFTQRIAQLIGISAHTQLHLLSLNDILDDQNLTLELFYAQIQMFLAEPTIRYSTFLMAFENYYNAQRGPLKEPFLTFDKQIRQCFGNLDGLRTKDPASIMLKTEIIIALQKKYREVYVWEHMYKTGDISLEELQQKLFDSSSDESIKQKAPGLYDAIFVQIYQQRATFSPDFTKTQLNHFFATVHDFDMLQSTIDVLNGMFT